MSDTPSLIINRHMSNDLHTFLYDMWFTSALLKVENLSLY